MDKRIEDVIKNFDFVQVHKVMQHLDWIWHDSLSEDKVPSVGELVLVAQGLMEKAIECGTKDTEIACGGFQVQYVEGSLNLMFVLTEYFTESLEE